MSDSESIASADETAEDNFFVYYEGFVRRKVGQKTLKPCQLQVQAGGRLLDVDRGYLYKLLHVHDWQIDKKIKNVDIENVGLRVDCQRDKYASVSDEENDDGKVTTLWLVLAKEQDRRQWKLFLNASMYPDSKEANQAMQYLEQQAQQEKIRQAEVDRKLRLANEQQEQEELQRAKSLRLKAKKEAKEKAAREPRDEWKAYTTEDGQVYYFNAKRQESSWENPAEPKPEPVIQKPPTTIERKKSKKKPKAEPKEEDQTVEIPPAIVEVPVEIVEKKVKKKKSVQFEGATQSEESKQDMANKLEKLLGAGPPPVKLTKESPEAAEAKEPDLDPTLSTAERLRLRRQERHDNMFTMEEDDTDALLRELDMKRQSVQQPEVKKEDNDPFSFPMDEWGDVEAQILGEVAHKDENDVPVAPAKVESEESEPEPVVEEKPKKKKKKKAPIVPTPPAMPPPQPEPIPQEKPKKSKKSKKPRKKVVLISSSSEEIVVVQPKVPKTKSSKKKATKVNILDDSSSANEPAVPSKKATKVAEPENVAQEVAESKPEEPQTLPNDPQAWSEHAAPDGRTYYYNQVTKTSVWQKPQELLQQHVVEEVPSVDEEPPIGYSLHFVHSHSIFIIARAIVNFDAKATSRSIEELIPPQVEVQDLSICPHCHSAKPSQRCIECATIYCDACASNEHLKYGSMLNHTMALLTVPFCQCCESASATQCCNECPKDQRNLCDSCSSFIHRKPPKHNHKRHPIMADGVPPATNSTPAAPNVPAPSAPQASVPVAPNPVAPPQQYPGQPQGIMYPGAFPMMPQAPVVMMMIPPMMMMPPQGFGPGAQNPYNPTPLQPFGPTNNQPQSEEAVYGPAPPPQNNSNIAASLPRCQVCGGWGIDLVQSNGRCHHCERTKDIAPKEIAPKESPPKLPSPFKPSTQLGDIDWDEDSDGWE
ncbi:hypothetical protein THRCLA_05957 [Thraustotheca clavata]|uniref:WW domain-containing protein n=1 Tax=Thraustotheca clavata TaxID=74557 RepID=A0A1V9ZRL3_9STRA|nr:hypothetical protein THRCLA_05957 [Thraustotheca clavata]